MLRIADLPPRAIEDFCHKHHIRRLSLFGSAVRADFNAQSDVDVLAEFEPGAWIGFLAISRMQRELAAILRRRGDLVPRAGLKPAIRDRTLNEEVVLYAARATLFARHPGRLRHEPAFSATHGRDRVHAG